ncbi:hypothetical protein EJ04DRAFT_527256 [Polyplosphaeria fusca]|uniref:Uncharacterized protein n=1 Tax=Polyplosphaeria fusca TaxID=682080 RepID=A0A9P4QS50_9PLEO|nr:hypothetical protein EJ04DRAFT_527256 [Polyplosphaeria fusca]
MRQAQSDIAFNTNTDGFDKNNFALQDTATPTLFALVLDIVLDIVLVPARAHYAGACPETLTIQDEAPSRADAHRILDRHLHSDVEHLFTIDATDFLPPPRTLCEIYSGTHPLIQEYVMRDPRAQRSVQRAVDAITQALSHDGFRRGKKVHFADVDLRYDRWHGRDKFGRELQREVALSTMCHAGTHRSVSLVEVIAQELRELARSGVLGNKGLEVRIIHVHRKRGIADAR